MTRLILLLALGGDQTARDLCECIGGVVASISLDARIWETCEVPRSVSWDMLTLERLGAGIIDDAEATRRNLERWEP